MAVLDKIRSKGVLLVTAIGIALAAFIIGDFLNSGSSYFNKSREIVGKIAGEDVNIKDYTAAIEQMTEVYKIETGKSDLNDEMMSQIRAQVWETMVNDKILSDEAKKVGLAVSPDELSDRLIGKNVHQLISQRRAFAGENGQFSQTRLVQFLNSLEETPTSEEMRVQIASAKSYWLFWEKTVKSSILQEKYTTLMSKSLGVNSLEAKMAYNDKKASVDVSYVVQPYFTISDSAVTVSDGDIKDRYEQQKEKFKQDANCGLNLVSFNISPLKEDFDDAAKWMAKLAPEFKTTTDVIGLVNSNSDVMYDGHNYSRQTVPANLQAFAFSGQTGDVVGPMFVNNTYTMARIMQAGILQSDSVKLRHIFLVQKDEAKADSLVESIRAGANFGELAMKYSAVKQTAAKGGEIGWLQEGGAGVEKELTTTAFSKGVNEVFTLKNAQGTQVFQVMDKTAPRSKVKLAILERKVVPSSKSYSKIYNEAKQFAASDLNLESFEKAAKAKGYFVRPANDIMKTTDKIVDIPQSRQIVKWAFSGKKGDMSDVFECDKQFVVAIINEVNAKGYRSLEKVKDQLKAEVVKDKKAELIIAKLQEQLAKNPSLQALATGLKDSVKMAKSINFASYAFGTYGLEPNVIGKVSVAQLNKLSAPIKGNAGVFVFNTSNKVVNPQPFNAKMEAMQLGSRLSYSLPYMIMQDLKDKSDVVDNRINFY